MTSALPYEEEDFGIETDDKLYLDCTLVKPTNVSDKNIRAVRAWVPKYPLTKSSVIACARQEVKSHGANRKIAHLVFDLRGTGQSDGIAGDQNFQLDLHAVSEWARERFGRINFAFLGTPTLQKGRVNMWPLRQGSVMESYYYPPTGGTLTPPSIIYLSTYGNFGRTDDTLCSKIAAADFHVYGLDPLRYLLHACGDRRLTPDDLWDDIQMLTGMLPSKTIIIGQPMAAGLAILWASRIPRIEGIIAIGRAQDGFKPSHIFQNNNPYTFLLNRYIGDIAPRPLALVRLNKHALGGDKEEMAALFESSKQPHRLEETNKLTFDFLNEILAWVRQKTDGQ